MHSLGGNERPLWTAAPNGPIPWGPASARAQASAARGSNEPEVPHACPGPPAYIELRTGRPVNSDGRAGEARTS